MKLQILQKAYHVWHEGMIGFGPEIANSIDETEVVYADKPSEAKTKANDWSNWELNGEEATFIDLKCKRAKAYDVVTFNGKNMKRHLVSSELADIESNKKLDEILANPNIKYCYIYKRGYYRPNFCGYTDMKHRAGVYTKEEAVKHAKGIREIHLERIDIEEHNKMIQDEIKELERKLISD